MQNFWKKFTQGKKNFTQFLLILHKICTVFTTAHFANFFAPQPTWRVRENGIFYLIHESPKMVSWESIPHLIFFMENRPSLTRTHPSSNLFRSWWLWSTKIEFSVQSRQFSPPTSFYASRGIYLEKTGEQISGVLRRGGLHLFT